MTEDESGFFEVRGPSLQECLEEIENAKKANDLDGVKRWERLEKECRDELSRLSKRNLYLIKTGWLTD